MDDLRRPRLYPVEPWAVRETSFDPSVAARNETIFALGNGHLGIRGTLEEPSGNALPGTYVNGFHERLPIEYGEAAYGYARHNQVLLNVADATRIVLYVDDEPLDLATGTLLAHERVLDLRHGRLDRRLRWRSPSGALVQVATTRLVSLVRPSIAAIEYRVTLLEGTARLRLDSSIEVGGSTHAPGADPRIGATLPEGTLRVASAEASDSWSGIAQQTRTTGLSLGVATCHALEARGAAGPAQPEEELRDGRPSWRCEAAAVTGTELRLTKTAAYVWPEGGTAADALAAAAADALAAHAAGFAALLDEQRAALDAFWAASDVEIEGDEALQQGVRYNLFSLLQAAGHDGRTSLPAKGLTGEGYQGHYFWDTEIFALPFFVYTRPATARALLAYRVATLDRARARAVEMSQRGALYPWRTIDGDEASAYFPAGTAQYHIDADIAYAFARYLAATGDDTLLDDGGAEVVVETARLWADLGAFIPSRGGAFCINEVTGPDEYTALVDNNAYTNLMARRNLRFAADLVDRLGRERPAVHERLVRDAGLAPDEVAAWRRAADRMRIPRDEALGVHAQDDAFLGRERWDFETTPPSMYPLLLHVHPLVIYRHQVLKQPDVVLAQVLLASEFTLPEKRRNFDYYDPLTTGDSSLSPCIQSVAAAELGYDDLAYRYFMATARMDLDDVNGNVSHGVHIAAMAGSWVSVVCGFAGFRDDDGRLAFAPRLPMAWTRLRFRLRAGDAVVEVTVRRDEVGYELLEGDSLAIRHFGRPLDLVAGAPAVIDLRPALRAIVVSLDVLEDRDAQAMLDEARLAGVRVAAVAGPETRRPGGPVAAGAAPSGPAAGVDLVLAEPVRPLPDPDRYLQVADRLAERPADCVGIVGSSAEAQALAASGMRVIRVWRRPAIEAVAEAHADSPGSAPRALADVRLADLQRA